MLTELSWSHFQELLRIDRESERKFYINETIKENWGYRELNRHINTKLYDRYLISPDKQEIMKLSQNNKLENGNVEKSQSLSINCPILPNVKSAVTPYK